jgi:hypothetical protein
MSKITIPPAALEAACKAYELYFYDCFSDDAMRLAIAAALAAWPGVFEEYMNNEDGDGASLCVILPLTQQASDE